MGFQLPTSTGERRISEPSTVSYNHGIVLGVFFKDNRFEWSIHPKHSRISNMKKVVIELCGDENCWMWLPRDFCLKMLTQVKMCLFCFFPKFRGNQLMVNCWFGGWWFGFLESPKMKGIGNLRCTPIRIPNHKPPGPKPTSQTISWGNKFHKNNFQSTEKPMNWIDLPPQIPRNPQLTDGWSDLKLLFLKRRPLECQLNRLMNARSKCLDQWLFLVPLKGGIGSIFHPPEGKDYKWYISGIYCQLGDYMLPTTF